MILTSNAGVHRSNVVYPSWVFPCFMGGIHFYFQQKNTLDTVLDTKGIP